MVEIELKKLTQISNHKFSKIMKYIQAEAKYVDSYGNSTRPKTPQENTFLSEEAEAVPVESEVF